MKTKSLLGGFVQRAGIWEPSRRRSSGLTRRHGVLGTAEVPVRLRRLGLEPVLPASYAEPRGDRQGDRLLHAGPPDSLPGNKRPTKIVAALEREIFLSGCYKALDFGAGPCRLCKDCNLAGCIRAEDARPAMEACGIDVFATARANGFPIEVVHGRVVCGQLLRPRPDRLDPAFSRVRTRGEDRERLVLCTRQPSGHVP